MDYQLLYASAAARPMSAQDLQAILDASRRNNAAQNITGLLIYQNQQFMQALEGDESAVLALYDKIRKDKRHYNTRILWEGNIEKRSYSKWSMGFVPSNALDPGEHAELIETQRRIEENATKCQALMSRLVAKAS